MKKNPKLLGIAGSLRNARWGAGNQQLIQSLVGIEGKEELLRFLESESEMHLQNFLDAGRREGKPFEEIYKNLRKDKGVKGLSNSEVALAAGLWSAYQYGVDIDHISLAEYFLASGHVHGLDELKSKLLASDGILVSGPVYFGDRGSLVQSLLEWIWGDEELRQHLDGKFYAGIAVGAKRNGGQETTLVYQMLDFSMAGMLTLGNDSETTSQYGGTGKAGDVGTMHADQYGLDTSMGTGRRIGSLLRATAKRAQVKAPSRVLFLVLQDRNDYALNMVRQLTEALGSSVSATIVPIASSRVLRCIACDICPTDIDLDSKYRCIIKAKADDLPGLHAQFLSHDLVVPVVYSGKQKAEISTNYQSFIERTRYLRRGDYVFSNQLVAPLVIEELGVQDNFGLRMMTSFLRHHTVMSRPIIQYLHGSERIDFPHTVAELQRVVEQSRAIAAARISATLDDKVGQYNPVGYVLSANKDIEDERLNLRVKMMEERIFSAREEAATRIEE